MSLAAASSRMSTPSRCLTRPPGARTAGTGVPDATRSSTRHAEPWIGTLHAMALLLQSAGSRRSSSGAGGARQPCPGASDDASPLPSTDASAQIRALKGSTAQQGMSPRSSTPSVQGWCECPRDCRPIRPSSRAREPRALRSPRPPCDLVVRAQSPVAGQGAGVDVIPALAAVQPVRRRQKGVAATCPTTTAPSSRPGPGPERRRPARVGHPDARAPERGDRGAGRRAASEGCITGPHHEDHDDTRRPRGPGKHPPIQGPHARRLGTCI